MSVSSAAVRTPWASPNATIVRASRRAWSRSGMNAPDPVFTSSTRASAPSAIFFDMIDEAMSGIDWTVDVMSRRAYKRLSAGARSAPAAAMTAPICGSRRIATMRPGSRSARHPGMDSILSSVPPV